MAFRDDVNALRALAILGVLLFHLDHSWMPGGFSGVDIFFVISGYLMTGIVVNRVLTNQSTIYDFYIARVRRIVPGLLVLCFTVGIFGFFFVQYSDFRGIGKHIISSVIFLSNIAYYFETDYFAVAASENFLLHTWSLSVEWQFYLIFPLIMLLLQRCFGRKYLGVSVVLLTAVSFVFSCVAVCLDSRFAFFFLPSRAWEMFLGGLFFCILTISQKM